ncbi:MAG TPA: alpha/beta hydrolase [Candidatus Hydrogenedentes bacterium]|nr:alpha/beta hydrolase [Candidatus Hydrogenedentota bacterium]
MRRKAIRIILRVILFVAAIYGVVVVLLYAFQTAMIFPAGRDIWRTPSDGPFTWPFEDVYLEVGPERTHGWFIPHPNPGGVVLFSHGNGGTIADRLEHFAMIRELGFSVFAYDYGGYGKSTGEPSESRCYADALAAWNYLTQSRKISPATIVLYGESLGGGVACELAMETQPRALVLQNTFLSVVKRAKEVYPIIPVDRLLKHRFENDVKLPYIKVPVLIIHSPDDTIIPFHHGVGLYELAREPKSFLELAGDHNECIYRSEQRFKDGLREFLSSHPAPLQ